MPIESFYALRGADIVTEAIDGEVVVIDLESGSYYSLEGSGAFVWECLRRGDAVTTIVAQLEAQFPQEAATIVGQVNQLVAEMCEAKLIEPSTEPTGDAQTPEPPLPTTPTGFSLQVYTDMQELLMLDPIHEVEASGWPKAKESTEESES